MTKKQIQRTLRILLPAATLISLYFVPWTLLWAWILPLPDTVQEQEIYSAMYAYDHTALIPGYQSIARYHRDIDAVVIQFVNTTNFSGYTWNLSEIIYDRVVKILRNSIS